MVLNETPIDMRGIEVLSGYLLHIPIGKDLASWFEDIDWTGEEIAAILQELEKYEITVQTGIQREQERLGDDKNGYDDLLIELEECPKEKPSDPELDEAYNFRKRMLTKRPIFVNNDDGWKMCRFCEELWRKREASKMVPLAEHRGTIQLKVAAVMAPPRKNTGPRVKPPQ